LIDNNPRLVKNKLSVDIAMRRDIYGGNNQ